MVFEFDISRLKAEAKKTAKATGQKLAEVHHAMATARGYTSWSSMISTAVGPEQPEALVAWFERKHEPVVGGNPREAVLAPRAILVAAGYDNAPGLEQAVATLESRGPWKRKAPAATIRKATDSDLTKVLQWAEEDERNGYDSFFCNRGVIQSCHEDGEVYSLADQTTDLPIAYLPPGRPEPSPMAVKADRRRQGYGSALSQYMLDLWRQKDGASAIDLHCEPPQAIEFWERMGFTGYWHPRHDRQHGYMVLPKVFDLPAGAPEASVKISFFPERVNWQPGVKPLLVLTPHAVRTADGTIRLAERATLFKEAFPGDHRDIVVAVEIDGQEIYRDKAKYPGARDLGFNRYGSDWFIDEIRSLD